MRENMARESEEGKERWEVDQSRTWESKKYSLQMEVL
jgi:hypothetical protein